MFASWTSFLVLPVLDVNGGGEVGLSAIVSLPSTRPASQLLKDGTSSASATSPCRFSLVPLLLAIVRRCAEGEPVGEAVREEMGDAVLPALPVPAPEPVSGGLPLAHGEAEAVPSPVRVAAALP